MMEQVSTKIKITKPIKYGGVYPEEAFKIARDLMLKWRMNDGFKAPSDPYEAYVTVIDTSVYLTNSRELKYEFEALKGKDDNLAYMVERYIFSVEKTLEEYSRIKYFIDITRR